MKRLIAFLAALAVSGVAFATQTGTAQTQSALFDAFCDQCGAPKNTDLRNFIASVPLNASAAITGGTINGATIGATTPAAGTFTTLGATTGLLVADGACGTTPSIAFTSQTGFGFYKSATGQLSLCTSSATEGLRFQAGIISIIDDTGILRFGAAADTIIGRGSAAGQIKFGTTATGPAQLRTLQATAPTCTTNCGTGSPTVAGTDTAGIITLGTTPASAFQVNFNGTWATAPSCIVQSALATMVVGKMPIAVATTTTTLIVTTNGTAPATSDKYQYICMGVS